MEYQIHLIIEKRHLINWGYKISAINQMPAQMLSEEQYLAVMSVLYALLPKGGIYSKKAVKKAYQQAYRKLPNYLEVVDAVLSH